MQEIPIRCAIGPSYVPAGSNLKRASLAEELQLCNSQIVLGPGGTTSFSVFGVLIIFFVGIFLMIPSISLDFLTCYFRSKLQNRKHEYKQVQWGLDGVFQLHRLTYEATGVRGRGRGISILYLSQGKETSSAYPTFTPTRDIQHSACVNSGKTLHSSRTKSPQFYLQTRARVATRTKRGRFSLATQYQPRRPRPEA